MRRFMLAPNGPAFQHHVRYKSSFPPTPRKDFTVPPNSRCDGKSPFIEDGDDRLSYGLHLIASRSPALASSAHYLSSARSRHPDGREVQPGAIINVSDNNYNQNFRNTETEETEEEIMETMFSPRHQNSNYSALNINMYPVTPAIPTNFERNMLNKKERNIINLPMKLQLDMPKDLMTHDPLIFNYQESFPSSTKIKSDHSTGKENADKSSLKTSKLPKVKEPKSKSRLLRTHKFLSDNNNNNPKRIFKDHAQSSSPGFSAYIEFMKNMKRQNCNVSHRNLVLITPPPVHHYHNPPDPALQLNNYSTSEENLKSRRKISPKISKSFPKNKKIAKHGKSKSNSLITNESDSLSRKNESKSPRKNKTVTFQLSNSSSKNCKRAKHKKSEANSLKKYKSESLVRESRSKSRISEKNSLGLSSKSSYKGSKMKHRISDYLQGHKSEILNMSKPEKSWNFRTKFSLHDTTNLPPGIHSYVELNKMKRLNSMEEKRRLVLLTPPHLKRRNPLAFQLNRYSSSCFRSNLNFYRDRKNKGPRDTRAVSRSCQFEQTEPELKSHRSSRKNVNCTSRSQNITSRVRPTSFEVEDIDNLTLVKLKREALKAALVFKMKTKEFGFLVKAHSLLDNGINQNALDLQKKFYEKIRGIKYSSKNPSTAVPKGGKGRFLRDTVAILTLAQGKRDKYYDPKWTLDFVK